MQSGGGWLGEVAERETQNALSGRFGCILFSERI